jgi:hypothetical protein
LPFYQSATVEFYSGKQRLDTPQPLVHNAKNFLADLVNAQMSTYERPFLVSGRNTIIHKQKKLDLVIINGDSDPVVIVSRTGVKKFEEEVPANRVEAKERYMELVDIGSSDVFGESKTLLFVQALNNKEYKIDYTKIGTDLFIRVHQENYI